MANITYRLGVTPTAPTSTTLKGAALTNAEVDGNFKSLSDAIDTSNTTVIPVNRGGTGATNAASARTALSAAASGANSDITSLSSLSTALSVAQGGTGVTSFSGVVYGSGSYYSAATGAQITAVIGTTPVAVASKANNLSGASIYSIPYQSASETTSMLPASTAGRILQTNGSSSAPSWIDPSTLSVSKATNIAGGITGSIPYQSALDTTLMLSPGSPGQLLQTNGTGTSPSWVNLINIYAAMYPVGSVYINASNSTNPATLFGFGTWVAFGAGRVPVGFNAADPLFDTAEETGGSKDSTVVSHTHTGSTSTAGGHTHSYNDPKLPSAGTNSYQNGPQGTTWRTENIAVGNTGTAGEHSHTLTIDSAGSSGVNANLQPYITVYMWKRTA